MFKLVSENILLMILSLSAGFQLILSISQFAYRQSLQGVFYWFGERLFNLSTPGIAKASLNGVEFLRPYGTFSHPNSLAGFFLLLYFFILTSKRFDKLIFLKYVFLFISASLVFVSFSRLAIGTFLILNTLYWILDTRLKCRFCKIARIAVLGIISILFLNVTTDPLTVNKRIELMKNAIIIFFRQPFFGVGLGNYLGAQSQIASRYPLFLNQPVHNIYLLFIVETGLLLGGPIIYLLINQTYRLFKSNPYLVLTIFLTGFFDHYWFSLEQNLLVWALVYGSASIARFTSELSLRS